MTLLEGDIDSYKLLGDWALAAGRHLQSKQTGYVHYTSGEGPPYDAIPLVENALFALALFRARSVEQAQEAKTILKGLLHFQNLVEKEGYGNFPIYLHEYPQCCDPANGLLLLAPFYWILFHFGHVLGAPLKTRLEDAVRLALSHSLEAHKQKKFPYSFEVRLAAAQFAYGTLWHVDDWKQAGIKQLQELSKNQLDGYASSNHLGHILIGLQMAYPSLKDCLWEPIWQRMEQTWHLGTGSYVAPWVREWQEGPEPQVNLYDLFCGYFAGQFSQRAMRMRPVHLHGILIQQSEQRFSSRSLPMMTYGELKQQHWQVDNGVAYARTRLEKQQSLNLSVDQTFTPFQFIWGDLQRLHSFVCQGGNYDKVIWKDVGSSVELLFDLRAAKTLREIEFFLDVSPGIQFLVDKQSTSTFTLGQELKVTLGNYDMKLLFNLVEGEGDFLGHIMRGNRPSQIANKRENRFEAYDWTLFLRTIRRSENCRMRAVITMGTGDSEAINDHVID